MGNGLIHETSGYRSLLMVTFALNYSLGALNAFGYHLLNFFIYKMLVIGAIVPTTTLFIFDLLFLMVIRLHYSIQISKLSHQLKEMAQQVALLKGCVEGQVDP